VGVVGDEIERSRRVKTRTLKLAWNIKHGHFIRSPHLTLHKHFECLAMDESEDPIALKVQTLSDLELAVLICFVAEQHCIIKTEEELTNDVAEELKLVKWSHRKTCQTILTFCRLPAISSD
jgi:hypothetical protein